MSGSKRPHYNVIPSGFYQSTPAATNLQTPVDVPAASYYPYQFNNNTISNNTFGTSQNKRQRASTESVALTCDACDLQVFDSEASFRAHLASHIKCTACSFAAAPKIVKAHYQSVHGKFSGSGYKTVTVAIPGCPVQRFRICVGNRPEDVQEWIAQRKKRFPRTQRQMIPPPETNTTHDKNVMAVKSLLDGYDSNSDSEAQDGGNENGEEMNDKVKATADSCIMDGCTEVDSSEATKKNACADDILPQSSTQQTPGEDRRRICRFFARNGTCRNGENCAFRHEQQDSRQPKEKRLKSSRTANAEKTLLQKLLANDVQRETTITIQLLKFILDNQFFEQTTIESSTNVDDDDISF